MSPHSVDFSPSRPTVKLESCGLATLRRAQNLRLENTKKNNARAQDDEDNNEDNNNDDEEERARSGEIVEYPGPYALQAAIAACHAQARTPEETDWPQIVALYQQLARLTPSPIVELNRAVAVAMAFGPTAGLELVDALTSEPSLASYHLLPSVRGDLLLKLGRADEARAEFERAAGLSRNTREREFLIGRARACGIGPNLPKPH